MAAVTDSLYRVVTEAINDILEHGYDSRERVERWLDRIQLAATYSLVPLEALDDSVRKLLTAVFTRATRGGKFMRVHKGISKFTLAQIEPRLHAELDRRIMAAADLIKLNREQAMAETLRRFSGWSTSIPAGGTEVADRMKIRRDVRKSLASLPYVERRCVVDQSHKLAAAINEIVADDGGAIGGFWRSHWREAGYQYRESHKLRDGVFYVRRGCWADERGYFKRGHYYDEVTAVGEEVSCRCYMEWCYALSQVPRELLTSKGVAALAEARSQMHAAGFAAH